MVGGDDHGVRAAHRLLERLGRGSGACGSCAATSASSRSSSRISFARQRVAQVVRVALERQAEHRDLLAAQRSEPALDALDQEQRHALVHARDRHQHAGRARALLREREVLAQARAAGQARHRDAAARVVAVDQVDHLEHVRAVLLAVHHQEIGQREVRVAEDVGPDLRELGLHRRGALDPRAEHLEQARDPLGGLARRRRRRCAGASRSPRRSGSRRSAPARARRTRRGRPRGRAAARGSRRRTRSCRARRSSAARCGARRAAPAAASRAPCGCR